MEDNKESFGKVFLREFISFLKYFAIAFIAAFMSHKKISNGEIEEIQKMINDYREG